MSVNIHFHYNIRLFILSIFIITVIPQTETSCDSYTDCLQCSSNKNSDCIWEEQCKDNKSEIDNWFEKYSQCLLISNEQVQPYCNIYTPVNTLSFQVSLKKNNETNSFFKQNLYCMWEINSLKKDSQVEINLKKAKNADSLNLFQYSLVYHYRDNSKTIKHINGNSFSEKLSSLEKIEFHFSTGNYDYELVNELINPFTFEVKYVKKITVFDIVIIVIAVILILFLVVIIVIMIYQIVKTCNKSNEEITHNIIDNEIIIPRRIPGSSQTNSVIDQGERNKELLQNILKPFDFNDSHQNIYGNYCSICADVFSEGTKVICLACHHIFHENCIWKWCEEKILHPTCPNCNEEILNKKVHRGKEELLLLNHNNFGAEDSRVTGRGHNIETNAHMATNIQTTVVQTENDNERAQSRANRENQANEILVEENPRRDNDNIVMNQNNNEDNSESIEESEI